jgi:type IV secretion system protein VirB10
MAISDKSILDPEPPKPGIPLKKSTLAVLAILVLVLGLVSSLLFGAGSPSAAPTAVVKDPSELKQRGSGQAITDEEVAAERAARPSPTVAAAPTHTAVTPLPAGSATLVLPAGVRRDENASALVDNRRRAAVNRGDADVEQEAAVRISKSLVQDFDEAPREREVADSKGKAWALLDAVASGAPQLPSAYVTDQVEKLKTQLLAGQNAAHSEQSWLKEYAKETAEPRRSLSGYPKPQGLVLQQGKVIPAVLGRQINSDLPGRITAYVSADVFDASGKLVIPKGSVLVGRYDSGVKVGQSRLLFAFERLILTNGFSFDLPAAAGTDLAGAAGMTGDVNNHFFKMFGSSLLIGFLADRTRQPSSVTSIGGSGSVGAAGQVLGDVSKTILERNRVIQPTITVEQGTRINVEVVADMVFPSPESRRLQ